MTRQTTHQHLRGRGAGRPPRPADGSPQQVSFLLSADTIAALDRLAERHRCRRADEVRAAIDVHIQLEAIEDAA